MGKMKKPMVYGIAVLLVFGMGWKVNGWRLESKHVAEEAKRAEEVQRMLLEREAQVRARWFDNLRKANELSDVLNAELAEIKTRNYALSAEIDAQSLIKAEIITCPITGEKKSEPPNPFNNNFVDLWNSAGRMRND
jgi:hypothetical protein